MQKFYIKVVPLLGQLGEASYRCFHPVTVINPLQSALASQSTTTAVLQVKKLVAALTINTGQEEAEAVSHLYQGLHSNGERGMSYYS